MAFRQSCFLNKKWSIWISGVCTFLGWESEAVQDFSVVNLHEFITAIDCKVPYFLRRVVTMCNSEIAFLKSVALCGFYFWLCIVLFVAERIPKIRGTW